VTTPTESDFSPALSGALGTLIDDGLGGALGDATADGEAGLANRDVSQSVLVVLDVDPMRSKSLLIPIVRDAVAAESQELFDAIDSVLGGVEQVARQWARCCLRCSSVALDSTILSASPRRSIR
jgi:hypothetical protein